MTWTPNITPALLMDASERTDVPVRWVEAPMELILSRHVVEGLTAEQIAQYMGTCFGAEHPVASLDFVSWVIGQFFPDGGW
jgi:hypothetical protein